jgi:hypothetical protein
MSTQTLITAIFTYHDLDNPAAKDIVAVWTAANAFKSPNPSVVGKIFKAVVLEGDPSKLEERFLAWETFLDVLLEPDAKVSPKWVEQAKAAKDKLRAQRIQANVEVAPPEVKDAGIVAAASAAPMERRSKAPKLNEYNGEPGRCGDWWSHAEEIFAASRPPRPTN